MNIQIIKGPNCRYNLFYGDAGIWIATDLSEGEVRDWFAIEGAAKANDILEAIDNGERPYGLDTMTYEDAARIAVESDKKIEKAKCRN